MNTSARGNRATPPQPTPFVGRRDELGWIARQIADPACRLLTLVGPGGIGKTRLALEAQAALADRFPDGTHFASLQAVPSSGALPQALVEALHLQPVADIDHEKRLLGYLSQRTALLILDNLEHLLDSARLLSELLAHSPGIKLIVTSRGRLNIREEWVLDVEGLPFPTELGDGPDALPDQYGAVQLYVQSARRVNPHFVLSDNAAAVARICALVDGTPLALELAASWSHVLTTAEIAEEIGRGLDILETTARDVPERHRNMRAVMDSSWKLLTDEQRDVFMRLAVFRSGFDRAAATHIAGATRTTLAALVDKSWLRHDERGRFAIHNLLLQYGEHQLEASGVMDAVRDAHCAYYARFIEPRIDDLKGRRQTVALAEVTTDYENISAAWHWAADHKRLDELQRMVAGLRLYFLLSERNGSLLFRHAEQQFVKDRHPERVRMWGRLVARAARGGDVSREQLETALHIARRANDVAEMAICLQQLGIIAAFKKHDTAQAKAVLEQSLTLYRQLGDRFGEADVLFDLVRCLMLSTDEGVWQDFSDYGAESLRLRREIGDHVGIAWALAPVAQGRARAGQFDEAERLWLERIAIAEEAHNPGLVALGYGHLSYGVYFMCGDFDKAHHAAEQAVHLGASLGFGNPVGYGLAAQGLLASMAESYDEGYELCQRAAATTSLTWIIATAGWGLCVAACGREDDAALSRHFPLTLKYMLEIFGHVGLVVDLAIASVIVARRGELVRAAEWLALAFNHPVRASAWMEKWPLLVRLRAELEAQLGAEAYDAAWERGKLLDTELVAAELLIEFSGPAPAAEDAAGLPQTTPLNERELAILRLVREGLPNRDIASRLYLAPTTVKWYLSEIYSKLGVNSRVQAIARARALRILV